MTRRAVVLLAIALVATPLAAQQIRVDGATVAQVVQMPTLKLDSIPIGNTTGTGDYRLTPDGYVAWCQPGFAYCLFRRSGPTVTTAPIWQDIDLNAWGFGEGWRVYGQVRYRATAGDQAWPMSDQRFSVLSAYVEYDHSDWRARLGRQFTQNGLGYYNYDGLDALWRASRWLDAEVYGGLAPMEAVNAPYTNTVITDQTSPIAPNDNAYLMGARVRGWWQNGSSISGIFQFINRVDLRGLYAEQGAVNGLFRAGITTITGDLQFDFSTDRFNLAQAKVQFPVAPQTGVFAEARHYAPFFQLWSIWAVFSPVGYNEANVGAFWNSPQGVFAATLSGGYRKYENPSAGIGELRSDGYRVGADVTWHPDPAWVVRAAYHYDLGPGAAESDGNFSVRWDPNQNVYAGIFATLFQTAYEYEQGWGTVGGGGVTGGVRLSHWGRLAADVGEYRNTYGGNAPQSNWDQFRASLRFEFDVGAFPDYMSGGQVR